MAQRGNQENLVYQDVLEILDWLVCPDQWDQLGVPDPPVHPGGVFELDLMTWRALEVSPTDFLASEDQKEFRVLLDYLDFRVNRDFQDFRA